MSRQCTRPGCAEVATATLGYDYASSTVWLDDLSEHRHPATYDLCSHHAGSFGAPRRWQLRDQRTGTQSRLRVVAS